MGERAISAVAMAKQQQQQHRLSYTCMPCRCVLCRWRVEEISGEWKKCIKMHKERSSDDSRNK